VLKLISFIRKHGNCYIPRGAVVHGGMDVSVPLYVYGTIYGEVKASTLIYLGNTGSIIGNVSAGKLIVDGNIQGEIIVAGKAKIRNGATITGNISASPLIIDNQAHIDAKINAISHPSPDDTDQPSSWI